MAHKNWSEKELRQALGQGGSVEHGGVGGGVMERDSPISPTTGHKHPVAARNSRKLVTNPAHAPQTFFVPGPLPGANDIVRKHWRVYSKLKSHWGLIIGRCILIAKIKPIRSCAITYHWIEPAPVRGHIRDRDNIRFGAKFINDAIVAHGILLDDGPEGVVRLTDTFTYNAANPGVQIILEEV